jgi:hypothetical protein
MVRFSISPTARAGAIAASSRANPKRDAGVITPMIPIDSIPRVARRRILNSLPLLLAAAPAAIAGNQPPVPPAPVAPGRSFERIWARATLYRNVGNPWIQEFKLRGRYHGQQHWLDSDQGGDQDWENRRVRYGFDARLFAKTTEIRLDAETNEDLSEAYATLIDAYVKWKPLDGFSLTLGRQKPGIAHYDWVQSTTSQPTFERSQIFNQLRVNRATGLLAEGADGAWSWQAGVYSSEGNSEFGSFSGGHAFTAGIGYDFAHALGTEKALAHVDWLHSEAKADDNLFNRYGDIVSATLWLEEERWAIVAEGFAATGGGDPDGDVFGFFFQPAYDLIPGKMQLVGRYSFAVGDGPDSVIAQSRYERSAPSLGGGGRGDRYHAFYAGAQWFIHGDKLKFMAGAEYASLDGGGNGGDYDGLTALAGVRLYF